jgi:preprotein translocase subunit SecY
VFSNVKNMFKIPDLRGKIIFTLAIIALYRFGAHVPTPGVDFEAIEALSEASQRGGVLGFLNLFSGGALTRFAIFGLGIMPYITSSIIMQLLQVVIPKLEEWRDQGAVGQKKITQATRYVTVALAIMQSTALAFAFHNGAPGFLGAGLQDVDLIPDFSVPRVLLVVLSMTAGTAVVMWLGELITQRGIGQGMSILIFSSVVSGMPSGGAQVRAQAGNFHFVVIMALVLVVLVAVIFVEQGQRRIPVQVANRVVGR